jgi:pyruvate, water dikinase
MAKADTKGKKNIYWFSELGIQDVPLVGGKNASLGEMFANLTNKGVRVPDGYAISAPAYTYYITKTGIRDRIVALLKGLNVSDLDNLAKTGKAVRELITGTRMPEDLERDIAAAYDELCKRYGTEVDTAVRSSATAEDLPDASFAGQQDTYLNVKGHENLFMACRKCFASLFTDRAIAYREEKKFDHFAVQLSIAVQKMVRSDLASAGVMFSIDTESGFKDAAYVTGGYGLGENVVQGAINPDEWYVHKPTLLTGKRSIVYSHLGEKQQKMVYVEATPENKGRGTANVPVPDSERQKFCLTQDEVLTLAKWACIIEDHYSQEAGKYKPMDMEWAKDGQSNQLFIVQARPETVMSRRDMSIIKRTVLEKTGPVLAEGMAVGDSIGTGPAIVIKSAENIKEFKAGNVLVTEMTDPDWVPIMKIASAIVTDQGGRTCHAAIISRELGIPCIVGTGNGSKNIPAHEPITVSCAGGSKGIVYKGQLPYKQQEIHLADLEMPKVPMYYMQSDPDRAFPDSRYPHAGVALLRIDELLKNEVKVHPKAALAYKDWKAAGENADVIAKIDAVSLGYPDKAEFVRARLAEGMARIAAAAWKKPVRVLLSDAPSPELDKLIGGTAEVDGSPISFKADDKNPLLGIRGAARYTHLDYEDAFKLELDALVRVRNDMGMVNVSIVFPACQGAKDTKAIANLLTRAGLKRGENGLEYHLLCRTPAQLMALDSFAADFDGFVIDVAELTQLMQGIDAGNVQVRGFYDDKHPAVVAMIDMALEAAKKLKKPAGLANIPPGATAFYATQKVTHAAKYVAFRPEVYPTAREEMLQGQAKAK